MGFVYVCKTCTAFMPFHLSFIGQWLPSCPANKLTGKTISSIKNMLETRCLVSSIYTGFLICDDINSLTKACEKENNWSLVFIAAGK